ncbi:hypothetical protein GTO91_16735 [Heliobacterium undosum]|uniref:Uncharacterized protein n=1 Tax=Heliomicrobium undosum TaxID=121734 RepID=A0A845LCF9_9FIRM|nr:hypothetical protein [Heliomicrobium undosum]MZP31348.1 hypothetical protein [Heliomicrobium undosum]
MFNSKMKKEAIKQLTAVGQEYATIGEKVKDNSILLLKQRQDASTCIKEVESYINRLANTPKEFQSKFEEIRIQVDKFRAILDLQFDDKKAQQVTGSVSGAGVAMGAGVAAFGPSAAMAIATTFGTASTGTAISALSGAAATNAALAWLGGGALAAGGGGMAAGNALLAMTGPIGWAIGGLAITGGAVFMRKKNKEIALKAQSEALKISKSIAVLKAADLEISRLTILTQEHSNNLAKQLALLEQRAPLDYKDFDNDQKYEIGALVNNTLALSELINKKVGYAN